MSVNGWTATVKSRHQSSFLCIFFATALGGKWVERLAEMECEHVQEQGSLAMLYGHTPRSNMENVWQIAYVYSNRRHFEVRVILVSPTHSRRSASSPLFSFTPLSCEGRGVYTNALWHTFDLKLCSSLSPHLQPTMHDQALHVSPQDNKPQEFVEAKVAMAMKTTYLGWCGRVVGGWVASLEITRPCNTVSTTRRHHLRNFFVGRTATVTTRSVPHIRDRQGPSALCE